MSKFAVGERAQYQYASEHELQSLSVWRTTSSIETPPGNLWVVYVHGGAWRDPDITQTSFEPTITSLSNLSEHASALSLVAAFASLDYRLSAHPSHPQDTRATAASNLRNARHPDHVIDIKMGLKFLQDKFGFGSNYVLVGHSCGATLALQTVLGRGMVTPAEDIAVERPKGIAGVCGIYDMPLMLETNSHPAYREFVAGAFGEDAVLWETVSPAVRMKRDGKVLNGIVLILGYSVDDELIDEPQVRSLPELGQDVLVLRGGHDEIWQKGDGLARVVVEAVKRTAEK
ncbi:kynurenine formamidase protein [Venturia nashicola]|uniref:Kynurenine formamidase n=1 Tax=Venturia nashicola TaxID=86259 RepID=A0A4Z1PGX3_9PEZI|nr:kynurenine formamidase protein [Venturia nashicola]TLD37083.1 kynurenine formamidase protein [Venturia nashicola]